MQQNIVPFSRILQATEEEEPEMSTVPNGENICNMNDPTCGRKHANSIKTEKLDWYHKYSAIIEMNDPGVETAKCVFSAF